MNVIVIVLDSLRQDHVSLYHKGTGPFPDVLACRTPNLDRFAQDCIVFHNVYPEGLPTMPVRLALMTGQWTLPFRRWEPLRETDVTIAQILGARGYVCGMVSDTYHYRAPGMNYHRGFHAYRWIRGQEYDPYFSSPPRRKVDDYVNSHFDELWRGRVAQFLANTDDFTEEAQWFSAQLVGESIAWLRENRVHDKVFLWMDSFDPHEPWDPPARWDTYTDPQYRGPRIILPMGGPMATWATPEEVRLLRGLYAGEAAFVDHCLGRLFEAFGEMGYLDDSLIVITNDHGHPLGDHGKFLKGGDRMHGELLKCPFMVRLPGGRNGGRETKALAQFHDVLPTILDVLGMGNDTLAMHGRSLRPVLEGDTDSHREAVIVGYHEAQERCVRDGTWSYVRRPEGEPDELYNLVGDPRETRNLVDEHPEEARRLACAFGPYFYRAPVREVKGIQGRYEMGSGAVE
jgi:arylsulfatase A-like enzyme